MPLGCDVTDVTGLGALCGFLFVVVVCVMAFVDNNDDLIWIQDMRYLK